MLSLSHPNPPGLIVVWMPRSHAPAPPIRAKGPRIDQAANSSVSRSTWMGDGDVAVGPHHRESAVRDAPTGLGTRQLILVPPRNDVVRSADRCVANVLRLEVTTVRCGVAVDSDLVVSDEVLTVVEVRRARCGSGPGSPRCRRASSASPAGRSRRARTPHRATPNPSCRAPGSIEMRRRGSRARRSMPEGRSCRCSVRLRVRVRVQMIVQPPSTARFWPVT